MVGAIWTNTTGLLLDATGVLVCDNCPCTPPGVQTCFTAQLPNTIKVDTFGHSNSAFCLDCAELNRTWSMTYIPGGGPINWFWSTTYNPTHGICGGCCGGVPSATGPVTALLRVSGIGSGTCQVILQIGQGGTTGGGPWSNQWQASIPSNQAFPWVLPFNVFGSSTSLCNADTGQTSVSIYA